MQNLKRKSFQSPRDFICIFIGADLEMKMLLIENMRRRAFLLSCLRFSTSLFTTHTLKYRRLKNINKVLDKLLILDIRLFENRFKFSLTLDRRSALRVRAGQQISSVYD